MNEKDEIIEENTNLEDNEPSQENNSEGDIEPQAEENISEENETEEKTIESVEEKQEEQDIRELIKSFKPIEYFDYVNLHIHSKFSDGKAEFEDIIQQAKELGYKKIAICDKRFNFEADNRRYYKRGFF